MLRPRNPDLFAVGRDRTSFSRLSLLSGHCWPFHFLPDRRHLLRRPLIKIKIPIRLITRFPRVQTLHSQVLSSSRPFLFLVQSRWTRSRVTAQLRKLSITFGIPT